MKQKARTAATLFLILAGALLYSGLPNPAEQTLKAANRALAEDPTSLEALKEKKAALRRMELEIDYSLENMRENLETSRRIIQLNPNDWEAVILAADMEFIENCPEEAIAALNPILPEKEKIAEAVRVYVAVSSWSNMSEEEKTAVEFIDSYSARHLIEWFCKLAGAYQVIGNEKHADEHYSVAQMLSDAQTLSDAQIPPSPFNINFQFVFRCGCGTGEPPKFRERIRMKAREFRREAARVLGLNHDGTGMNGLRR